MRFSSIAAYWPARPIRSRTVDLLAHDVEAGDVRLAGVGLQQRGQDAHGGRLAGAVGAEQAEHRAGRHAEVDAVERDHVAEGLAQAAHADRELGLGGLPALGCVLASVIGASNLVGMAGTIGVV